MFGVGNSCAILFELFTLVVFTDAKYSLYQPLLISIQYFRSISAQCPTTFEHVSELNACYRVVSRAGEVKSQPEAEQQCQNWSNSAHLVSVDTPAKKAYLDSVLSRQGRKWSCLFYSLQGILEKRKQLEYHEFQENCRSVTFYSMKWDTKWCCDTTTPESIHTKDESKSNSAFAFIFGVNWPLQWM